MAREFKTFVDIPERQKLVHKRTTDASLSSIASVHLGRLNTLYEQGVRFYHHWDFQKYYSAELRILNSDISISMFPADSFYFEFFTTGNPVVTGMNSFGTSSAKAACVGVNVQLQMGSMTLNPKINTGQRNYDGTQISLVGRPYQVQLINEPVKFVPSTPPLVILGRQKYPQALYESYAPLHPHTGIYTNSMTVGWSFVTQLSQDWPGLQSGWTSLESVPEVKGLTPSPLYKQELFVESIPPLNSWNLRDVGFDIPFMFGEGSAPVEIALLNDGTTDWPRKNGLIKVTDPEWGTRTFALMIDAFSQFSVFPISEGEIGEPNGSIQNVQDSLVTTQGPMLPAWCYQMSETFMAYYTANHAGSDPTGNQHFPDISWSVHPSGLRACAVVYQQVTPTVDSAFIKSSFLSSFNSAYVQTQCGIEGRDGYPSGPTGLRYQYGTGLVEVTLTVTLTGPDPGDYTMNATVATLRQPTSTAYCSLLAGYSYVDIEGTCSAGDLIVVDVERWYKPGVKRPMALNFPTYTSFEGGTDFSNGSTLLDYTADGGGNAPYYVQNIAPGNEVLPIPIILYYTWNGTGVTETQSPAAGSVVLGAMIIAFNPSGDPISPVVYYWDDTRRTVYSVKNYGAAYGGDTSFNEINSFPGFPSGVKTDANDKYYPLAASTYESVITTPTFLVSTYVENAPGPVTFVYLAEGTDPAQTPQHPLIAPPLFSDYSSVILDFDIPTLSFALKLTTWESCSRLVAQAGGPEMAHSFHHSVAIYIKNVLVKQLFPTTMNESNQAAAAAALAHPFRDQIDSTYSMIALDDATTWGSPAINGISAADLLSLRYQVCAQNGVLVNGTAPPPAISQPCADWWAALNVYRPPVFLVLATTPSFAWYMYSDLIQNAIHKSPWSTFFVHPNGTWAFFDQSIVYNPYGHVNDAWLGPNDSTVSFPISTTPFVTNYSHSGAGPPISSPNFNWNQSVYDQFVGVPSTFQAMWAAFTAKNPMEHCIFDWVHFQFTMGDGSTQSKDTSFLELYNGAVANLDPNNVLDTFVTFKADYSDFRTTFVPYFNGYYYYNVATPTAGQWGFTTPWLGANNYNVGETDPESITGFSSVSGARWNFMSLARVNTGAYTQPYTFSSCTLIDT